MTGGGGLWSQQAAAAAAGRLELERSRAGGEECCCDEADDASLFSHGFRQVAWVEKRARSLFMLSVSYGIEYLLGKVYANAKQHA